jgi:hypothetical protein
MLNGGLMYEQKIYRTEVLNKMGHVFERYRFLMRTKSFNKEQMETIDYHLSEIMKVLNNF